MTLTCSSFRFLLAWSVFVVTLLIAILFPIQPAVAQNGTPGIRVSPQSVSPAEKAAHRATTRGQHLADTAIAYLGCAYKWGGESPKTGMDCSGLIVAVCRQWGISMPHSVVEQYKQGKAVTRDQLEAGDIIFFKDTYKPGLSHVAIYVGENRYVCAGDEKAGVVMFEFGPEGEAHYAGARRLDVSKLPPVPGEKSATASIPIKPAPVKPGSSPSNTPSPVKAMVNIRVCVDSGDRANSACPAYRVVKTTADQAARMKTCTKHHQAPGEKR